MKALSRRQEQIVEGILDAKSNKEIAFGLGLRETCVKVYLSRIFRKLGVASRMELANKVRERREAFNRLDPRHPERPLSDRFLAVAKHIELTAGQMEQVLAALLNKS